MRSKNFILLLALVAILTSSCGKVSSPFEPNYGNAKENVASESSIVSNDSVAPNNLKIVRNATLRIQVDSLEKVRIEMIALLKAKDVLIANESQHQSGVNNEISMVIKVPHSNFDDFVQILCKSGKYVAVKEVNSEEVSMQYIDLQARLNSKKELEARYLNLIRNSSKVDDLIKLEDKLSNVRSDIETLDGQFRFLNNQITYCTVNVIFYELVMPSSSPGLNYLSKAWLSIEKGWIFLTDASLLLLKIWPLLFLLYIVYYINKKYKIKSLFKSES